VYGNRTDLNHNLTKIIDGENREYLVNTYEADPQHPSFDQVATQIFGEDHFRISTYDLGSFHLGDVAPEDQPLLAALPSPQLVCPRFCAVPGSTGPGFEIWVGVSPNSYLVFPSTEMASPRGIPFPADDSLSAFEWYEVRGESTGPVI
jgi:hypothetical protein